MDIYEQLRRDEGDRATLYYLDGIPHIGIGHNLKDGPPLSPHVRETILRDDLATVAVGCEELAGWDRLSEARQGVLLNMAFAMGIGGLRKFVKMLQAVALGEWEAASQEILNSSFHTNPLTRERAERLALQMLTDTVT